MKLQRIFALSLPFAIVSSAYAALAPNYQRLAELKAIIADPAVISSFDIYHPIDRIEYLQIDLYRVTAGSCHVDVTIADKPADPKAKPMVGARQFIVKTGKKICS